MKVQRLERSFGIPEVLRFEETESGLIRAQVTTGSCSATVYLQGAHISHWQPAGAQPVLFTSKRSRYAPGEAIRGGVPVIFPWFGAYRGVKRPGIVYAKHGFARTAEWELRSARQHEGAVELVFYLGPSDLSRAVGYDNFSLDYTVRLGESLEMELTVQNNGSQSMSFEEALHSYFAVSDIQRTSVEGLIGAQYLDNTDGLVMKRQTEPVLYIAGSTDSIYTGTTAACTLRDEAGMRSIHIAKEGSQSTVVWNPWKELTATMPDLAADDWQHYLCVETANAWDDAVALAPGARHTMRATLTLSRL
jgi:glucose-6-phosphate 1-epimerase